MFSPGMAGSIAGGAMQGGKAGGPVGAGVGAGMGLLGGLSGGKEANKPTKSWIEPPKQLGGWNTLRGAQDWMKLAYDPSNWYVPGRAPNPFAQHLQNRLGIDMSQYGRSSPFTWANYGQEQSQAQPRPDMGREGGGFRRQEVIE